ncbi:Group 2 isoform 2 [Hibiscus syriacus]|uniref:Group 2 isoform 2 n=1 Tax=Hibiscus syriacus TaxID=106335 RepID=A0A6A3CB24_HIBSY|nr:Group 2 isoform 2 [Hibiscus syriacus]
MHAKTDSEGTSIDASWPPRSPHRPVYYVQSPSNHDVEKMSYGSSPTASPTHHYYHSSPIHHSRESSTSRFSASLKTPGVFPPGSMCNSAVAMVKDDDEEMDGRDGRVTSLNNRQDMISLNSTVTISYRNPATFYAVHVTSTTWELHYFQLKIASGQMKKFTQSRKSQRKVATIMQGSQVPLYGVIPALMNSREHPNTVAVP